MNLMSEESRHRQFFFLTEDLMCQTEIFTRQPQPSASPTRRRKNKAKKLFIFLKENLARCAKGSNHLVYYFIEGRSPLHQMIENEKE